MAQSYNCNYSARMFVPRPKTLGDGHKEGAALDS